MLIASFSYELARCAFSGQTRFYNTQLKTMQRCNPKGSGGVTDFLGYNLKRARTRLENDVGAGDCRISARSIPTVQMALLCGRGCCFFLAVVCGIY